MSPDTATVAASIRDGDRVIASVEGPVLADVLASVAVHARAGRTLVVLDRDRQEIANGPVDRVDIAALLAAVGTDAWIADGVVAAVEVALRPYGPLLMHGYRTMPTSRGRRAEELRTSAVLDEIAEAMTAVVGKVKILDYNTAAAELPGNISARFLGVYAVEVRGNRDYYVVLSDSWHVPGYVQRLPLLGEHNGCRVYAARSSRQDDTAAESAFESDQRHASCLGDAEGEA